MSSVEQLRIADQHTGAAIMAVRRADPTLTYEKAAVMVAQSALHAVKGCCGSETAAEVAYAVADAMATLR